MLAGEILNNNIPQLTLEDTVAKALQLIADYKVNHLPVVSDNKYLGLISENDLHDAENTKMPLLALQDEFIPAFINAGDHFIHAANVINQYQTDVIPVINEGQYIGTITSPTLLQTLAVFTGSQEGGGIIVLEMERTRFSNSDISRIVENNGATILHLNTVLLPVSGMMNVTLQLDQNELSVIIAAFKRYEYDVIYYFGKEQFESKLDTNYQNLMKYLQI